ncbi:MAG: hypothetical protein WD267_11275 [Balneolales bacterium]
MKYERAGWIILLFFIIVLVAIFWPAEVSEETVLERRDAVILEDDDQTQEDFPLSQWEIQEFQQKGLDNPVEDIQQDLLSKPEIIPGDGVLGGTMGFLTTDNIEILNNRWVLATYEDGHVMGQLLLRYEVNNNAQISWEILDHLEP